MNHVRTDSVEARTLAFAKMCGAGNDFIVIDGPAAERPPTREEIVELCDRRYGIGADGLMLLRPCFDGPLFDVDFFNADGSGGMLCGNGARCAIERARTLGLARFGEPIRFRFAGAEYRGTALAEGFVRFELDPCFRMDDPIDIRVDDLALRGRYVDVGSLHFVVDVADILRGDGTRAYASLDDLPVETLGRAVRSHPAFGASGVNANFSELRDDVLHVRTFERGVEGETLACGTGSTSSALARWREGEMAPPVAVRVWSGDELVVDFAVEADRVTRLSLMGPAFVAFEGRVDIGSRARSRRSGSASRAVSKPQT